MKSFSKRVIVVFLTISSIMLVANAAARKFGRCTEMITSRPAAIESKQEFMPGYLSIIEFLP